MGRSTNKGVSTHYAPLEVEMSKRLSDVFDMARFPLIILVLFIHVLPFEHVLIEPKLTVRNTYTFFTEMISHNLGKIAVPCFFIISGYYFFSKLESSPKISWYANQWKKRFYSLCLPYIIWNICLIAAILLKNYLFGKIGLGHDVFLEQIKETNWHVLLWTYPINYPLWYIRDLICMTLLTPFFYILFRYTKYIGLLFIAITYISTYDTNIPGLSMTAIFYFGTGAYLGINKLNLLELTRRIKNISYFIATILLILATALNGRDAHELVVRLFIPFGIISFFSILDTLANTPSIKYKLGTMAIPVFWIYVTHEIYILNWIKGFWHEIVNESPFIWNWIAYLTTPIVTLFCCLALYLFTRRYCPHILAFSTGNRIFSRKKQQ